MPETLDVHLYDTTIGTLTSRGSALEFTAGPDGLARWGMNSKILSACLPLSPLPMDATAFVGGLLPHGPALDTLRLAVGSDSLLDLIAYVGADTAGAATFGDHAPSRYKPLTDAEIADRLDGAAGTPLGESSGGATLPGARPKIVLGRIRGQWCAREGGAGSTYILKPADLIHESTLHEENYALQLAAAAGLIRTGSAVSYFNGRAALVIERYDRRARGIRIHQESAAQALGLQPVGDRAQGERLVSLRAIAALAPMTSVLAVDRLPVRDALLRVVTFNVAVGNTAATARSVAFMRDPDSGVRIAPIHSITLGSPDLPPDVGILPVNGVAHYPDVTTADLIAEARSWGMTAEHAAGIVADTLQRVANAVTVTPVHPSIAHTVPERVLGRSEQAMDVARQ